MHYLGRNASCFALQIVDTADLGWKFMNVGLNYPLPMFPQFLLTPLPETHHGRAQVPFKPSHVSVPGGDMRDKSREALKWIVAV